MSRYLLSFLILAALLTGHQAALPAQPPTQPNAVNPEAEILKSLKIIVEERKAQQNHMKALHEIGRVGQADVARYEIQLLVAKIDLAKANLDRKVVVAAARQIIELRQSIVLGLSANEEQLDVFVMTDAKIDLEKARIDLNRILLRTAVELREDVM